MVFGTCTTRSRPDACSASFIAEKAMAWPPIVMACETLSLSSNCPVLSRRCRALRGSRTRCAEAAAEVNAGDALDGERGDVIDVALHDPFESVAQTDDVDPLDTGSDCRRCDDAVETGRGAAPQRIASLLCVSISCRGGPSPRSAPLACVPRLSRSGRPRLLEGRGPVAPRSTSFAAIIANSGETSPKPREGGPARGSECCNSRATTVQFTTVIPQRHPFLHAISLEEILLPGNDVRLKETFGPVLRAARERCGVTLKQLVAETKLGVELWEGLEESDLARWPKKVFARSFVRDYANRVGLDPTRW